MSGVAERLHWRRFALDRAIESSTHSLLWGTSLTRRQVVVNIATRAKYPYDFARLIWYPADVSKKIQSCPGYLPTLIMNTLFKSVEEARITAGALRMRAHRQRRREGLRCVTLDLRDVEIDRLIELGHLRQADREDKNAVLLALSTGSSIRAR